MIVAALIAIRTSLSRRVRIHVMTNHLDSTALRVKPADDDDGGIEPILVWGADNIGKLIGRTSRQVRQLHASGFFGNAVWRAGHKTYVGNRNRLRNLVRNEREVKRNTK